MDTKLKNGTILLGGKPSILTSAAVGGKKEGEGPLAEYFDYITKDGRFGQDTWRASYRKRRFSLRWTRRI